jgi:hypothetical protein
MLRLSDPLNRSPPGLEYLLDFVDLLEPLYQSLDLSLQKHDPRYMVLLLQLVQSNLQLADLLPFVLSVQQNRRLGTSLGEDKSQILCFASLPASDEARRTTTKGQQLSMQQLRDQLLSLLSHQLIVPTNFEGLMFPGSRSCPF